MPAPISCMFGREGGHKKGHGIVLTKTVSLGRMVGDTKGEIRVEILRQMVISK